MFTLLLATLAVPLLRQLRSMMPRACTLYMCATIACADVKKALDVLKRGDSSESEDDSDEDSTSGAASTSMGKTVWPADVLILYIQYIFS